MSYKKIISEIKRKSDKKRAVISQSFFKTKEGEYGEGDIFLGLTVPVQRSIALKFVDLSFIEIEKLLKSTFHEYRFIGLIILIERFRNTDNKGRDKIYTFYLRNIRFVNSWDLVDLSAPQIVGRYLQNSGREQLYIFCRSESLWERRISVVSTIVFIKNNDFKDALKISAILLADNHYLINKAVGWMLREIGKKDMQILENFLKMNSKKIPRTTLRYAIEKFPEKKRKKYLKK